MCGLKNCWPIFHVVQVQRSVGRASGGSSTVVSHCKFTARYIIERIPKIEIRRRGESFIRGLHFGPPCIVVHITQQKKVLILIVMCGYFCSHLLCLGQKIPHPHWFNSKIDRANSEMMFNHGFDNYWQPEVAIGPSKPEVLIVYKVSVIGGYIMREEYIRFLTHFLFNYAKTNITRKIKDSVEDNARICRKWQKPHTIPRVYAIQNCHQLT